MLDKRLVKRAAQEKKYFYTVLGSGFFTGILAILQAACLAKILNEVFTHGQGLDSIRPWLFALFFTIVFRALSSWLGETAARRAGARIKHNLRQELLSRLFELGPVSGGNTGTGEKLALLVEGVENLEAYFTKYLPQLVLALFVPLALLLAAFPVDWISALILLFTAPLIPIFMILIGGWSEKMAEKQWATLKKISNHLFDVLQGLTTLKLLGRSKKQIAIIARLSKEWTDSTLSVLRIAFLSALTLELIVTFSTAMMAVGLGLRLLSGNGIDFERAMFLLLLAPEFYGPLRALGTQFHAGQQGSSAADDIFSLLDEPLGKASGAAEEQCSTIFPAPDSRNQAPALAFSHVSYAYDSQVPVLNDVSFSIAHGEKVALLGKSGTGKSTILHLIMGFISPDQGYLEINGLCSHQSSPEAWRKHLALIPQRPHLFSGTVQENLLLGNPHAQSRDVEEAARLAHAHDFIKALPEGYHTQIGQGGWGLSAGQIQRLAIARVFLSHAPILILDEATAGLDYESEHLIRLSLEELLKTRTALIVAHRPATLKLVDRAFFLDDGHLQERQVN